MVADYLRKKVVSIYEIDVVAQSRFIFKNPFYGFICENYYNIYYMRNIFLVITEVIN